MDFGGGGKSETSGSNGWKVDTPHDSPLQTETHPNANSGNDYSYYGKTGGRRGLSSGGKNGGAEYSPNGDELIKVAVLGAPGVGKTSIIQQFVWGNFEHGYYPTSKKEYYYPVVTRHDKKFALKVVEIPDIPFLPINSYYNVTDLQTYGLKDPNAYILVYDLLQPDTFDYISSMFNQINESRDLTTVPVVVVGNKTDKISSGGKPDDRYEKYGKYRSTSHGDSYNHHDKYGFGGDEHDDHHDHHDGGFRSSSPFRASHGSSRHGHDHHDDHGFGSHGFGSHHNDKHKKDKYGHKHGRHGKSSHDRYGHSSHYGKYDKYRSNGHSSYGGHGSGCGRKFVLAYDEDNIIEGDISDKVKNEWGAFYKECSANQSESVNSVFKSLLGVVDTYGIDYGGLEDDMPKKCTIL